MQDDTKNIKNSAKKEALSTASKGHLLNVIEQNLTLIDEQDLRLNKQQQRIKILEEAIALSRVKRFAPSSEQSENKQQRLFDEAELEVDAQAEQFTQQQPDTTPDDNKKPKTGRKPFSKNLPRVPVFNDLSDEEKEGAVSVFYTKVREELDITPAIVQVLEYYQEKAVFKSEDNKAPIIKKAIMPKHPLAKSMGSINLIAHVIIAKYADGLPLYRMEGILARYGGDINRATMSHWVINLSRELQPLINLMREQQLSADIIQMDETVLKVLKEPDRSVHSDKYMWVTRGGPPGQPSVLFEYDPSRSREVPLRLLDDFSGYLQTDGYAGYNAVCLQNNITAVGCWDHARRKFVDAQKVQVKAKANNKPSKADVTLSYINKLYKIERDIKTEEAQIKLQVRQKKSIPILEQLKKWVDNNLGKVPKNSLTGKALTYIFNQWDKLIVYCENGNLNISNILAENAIRPFCIGRKAWLFSDTPRGAHASGIHYSLIETAKANDIEPYAYLVYILKQLPYADTVEKLEELLPWNYKKQQCKIVNQIN